MTDLTQKVVVAEAERLKETCVVLRCVPGKDAKHNRIGLAVSNYNRYHGIVHTQEFFLNHTQALKLITVLSRMMVTFLTRGKKYD